MQVTCRLRIEYKIIFAIIKTTEAVVKKRPEIKVGTGFEPMTGVMLYQLSKQGN